MSVTSMAWKVVIVYPSGTRRTAGNTTFKLKASAEAYAEHIRKFIKMGVTLKGCTVEVVEV